MRTTPFIAEGWQSLGCFKMFWLISVCKGGKGFSNLESAPFLSVSGTGMFLTSYRGALPFVWIVRWRIAQTERRAQTFDSLILHPDLPTWCLIVGLASISNGFHNLLLPSSNSNRYLLLALPHHNPKLFLAPSNTFLYSCLCHYWRLWLWPWVRVDALFKCGDMCILLGEQGI